MKNYSPRIYCFCLVCFLLFVAFGQTAHSQIFKKFIDQAKKAVKVDIHTNLDINNNKDSVNTNTNNSATKSTNNSANKMNFPTSDAEVCVSGDCQNGHGKKESSKYKYEGDFKDGKFDGYGTVIFSVGDFYRGMFSQNGFKGHGTYYWGSQNRSFTIRSYEGNFANGDVSGLVKFLTWDNETFIVNTETHKMHGLGKRTKDGLTRLCYCDTKYDDGSYQGFPLEVMTHHLDTNFAKYKKVDELAPTTITFLYLGVDRVTYNRYVGIQSEYDGKETHDELNLKDKDVPGFINNTAHNIYIKGYRKIHPFDRDVIEYVDDSFVVKPGEKVMKNYRYLPNQKFVDITGSYYRQEYFYLGQYVEKEL